MSSDAVAVGLVSDSDGDGTPTDNDVPTIVMAAGWQDAEGSYGRGVVALDGLSGGALWWPPVELEPHFMTWYAAALDLDGDGWAEPVAARGNSTGIWLTALGETGQEVWSVSPNGFSLIGATSLDGGLGVDIIVHDLVLDGETGSVLLDLQVPPLLNLIHNASPVDLDGDSVPEFAVGPYVFAASGDLLWEPQRSGSYSQWWIPLEFDGDSGVELALLGEGWLDIYDGDGTVLLQWPAGYPYPFPPCAADLDGDGDVELAWAAKPSIGSSSAVLTAWDLDGAQLWSLQVADGGLSGCSTFDFDLDGASEVLFADEEVIYVLDGADGTVLFAEPSHESQTIYQSPIVADVDGDGSAEIVVVHSSGWEGDGWRGATVFGHASSLWPSARPTWPVNNLRDYRFDELGHFIGEPSSLVGETNLLRARAPIPRDFPDLWLRVVDHCWSGCEDASVFRVGVEVVNGGGAASGGEIEVELYLGGSDSAEATVTISTLAAMSVSDVMVFELPAVGSVDSLRFVVDHGAGGAVIECDEGNNELVWMPSTPCP